MAWVATEGAVIRADRAVPRGMHMRDDGAGRPRTVRPRSDMMHVQARDRSISGVAGNRPADARRRSSAGGSAQRGVPALLACGVASTALYIAMDVAAALRYDGYSYRSQTISELSAVGAPTRAFWLVASVPYGLLVGAFGVGVIAAARGRRSLRAMGALITTVGALALVAWPFAPMHQRDVLAAGGGTAGDTMHLVLSGADGMLALAVLGIGAATTRGRFRLYTLLTLATVLALAPYNAIGGSRLADDEPTPWLGIVERVMVFAPMVWFAALAVRLWRAAPESDDTGA